MTRLPPTLPPPSTNLATHPPYTPLAGGSTTAALEAPGAPTRATSSPIDLDGLDARARADLADQLQGKPGQRSWETKAALAERDDLIRELARRFYSDKGSINQQAQAVCTELDRYETGAWPHERRNQKCGHAPGSRQALVWQIFNRFPRALRVRAINAILSTGTDKDK